jgi:phosphonopyruvate decarboxylase
VIAATEFLSALADFGHVSLAGVPCSSLASVYQELAADARFRYFPAPNEGSAFAMAAGLLLAGRKPAVLIQNSGLGNLINPLTSLAMPYRVPVLTFVTVRGGPAAGADEAQHEVMGRRGTALLDALGLAHHVAPAAVTGLRETLSGVQSQLRRGEPVFVLIPAGVIAPPSAAPTPTAGFSRGAALATLTGLFPGALFVTTVGFISRELFALADRPENLYLQGAMGHAVSVAAGVATACPQRRVVAIDGDGSALMHLGALSLVGHLHLANLVHVILDNGVHESTGGQLSTAGTTAFTGVAAACGYRTTVTADSAARLREAHGTLCGPGPVLAHVKIAQHSPVPGGRPAGVISAPDLARRFAAAAGGPEPLA